MTETAYGREPIEIVEIEQPRCALRFGTAPCTATGTPKCFQTYWTCKDRVNYDPSGFIRWRFARPQAGPLVLYETFDNADEIGTNPIYMLDGVTTNPTRVNLAATRKGESPLGIRAGVTVTFRDQEWDDHVGDFYLADRSAVRGNFWAKWNARNPFYPGAVIRVYQGYRGQALADMQVRLFIMRSIDGPDLSGRVTIRGDDPLQLAEAKRALFPATSDIQLVGDIDAGTTTINVRCAESELTVAYGNTNGRKFLRLGSEIIEYRGQTGADISWTLTDVRRGVLNTVADSHSDGVQGQRVGRYDRMSFWDVAYDLITNHTPIPASFIDKTQWDDEGFRWLTTMRATGTVAEPTPVENLLGELCRDGLFFIWWDERQQTIPLSAVKPPQGDPVKITDDLNILADSSRLTTKPDDRLTRVAVYYGQFDPTRPLDDFGNYRFLRVRVDGEAELPEATGGDVRELRIFSRWIITQTNSFLVAAQILLRYVRIPQYVTIDVDAKDRALSVPMVVDLTTRAVVDTEGNAQESRWEVISSEEIQSGHKMRVELQSYLLTGRFAVWMDSGAPSYADATEAQRASGAWYADGATGRLPDGSDPYQYQ